MKEISSNEFWGNTSRVFQAVEWFSTESWTDYFYKSEEVKKEGKPLYAAVNENDNDGSYSVIVCDYGAENEKVEHDLDSLSDAKSRAKEMFCEM